jgi:energy-coupling factor transporter ATP-binding protein EcfA2
MSRQSFIETISELDGRSDQQIRSYYVETAALKRIRQSNVPSIGMVGLKGSGKTTLFRLLTEAWVEEPGTIRVGLAPDRSEFEGYADRLNCLQFANSVRSGMAIFLAELIDENIKLLPAEERSRLTAWIERKAAIFKPGTVAVDLLKRLRGLQILGCGLEIGDASERGNEFKLQRIPTVESSAIWSLLTDFQSYNIRIRIVVDDPDRLFTHNGKGDPHLLAGYILGTNEISKSLRYVQFVHIIKSNVLQELNTVEEIANLPHDYFDYISWSRDELQKLIESRISYANLAPTDVFIDPVSDAVSVISEQIRNGPRDTLRYLEIILKSSPNAKVSIDTISNSNSKFKRSARQQMEAVYNTLYEGIEPFLNAMFSGGAEITYVKFRDRFLELRLSSQPSGVEYGADWLRSSDRAFRALIEAGTVDVKTDEGWKRPYEAGYFLFDFGENALVRRNSVFI